MPFLRFPDTPDNLVAIHVQILKKTLVYCSSLNEKYNLKTTLFFSVINADRLGPFPYWMENQVLGKSLEDDTIRVLDAILTRYENIDYVIQIDGKKRTIVKAEKNLNEENILNIAKNEKLLDKYLKNKSIKKIIFVKNRLINILLDE